MDYLNQSYLSILECINRKKHEYDNVLLPIKPNYDFDFMLQSGNVFCRVKVIHTECKCPTGSYVANLRKSGGYNPSNTQKAPFDNTRMEMLYISTPVHKYWIPSKHIKNKRSLNLSAYSKYIIPE